MEDETRRKDRSTNKHAKRSKIYLYKEKGVFTADGN